MFLIISAEPSGIGDFALLGQNNCGTHRQLQIRESETLDILKSCAMFYVYCKNIQVGGNNYYSLI